MGEMLKDTDRQKQGEYQRLYDVTVAPTLAELGITKRESSEAVWPPRVEALCEPRQHLGLTRDKRTTTSPGQSHQNGV